MPTVRLIYDTGSEEIEIDAARAYKLAVNELLVAVHDNLPGLQGHPGEQLLQDAFTIMSFAGDPYEDRLRDARQRWREFRKLYGTTDLVPARPHPGVLLDVLVEFPASGATGSRQAATGAGTPDALGHRKPVGSRDPAAPGLRHRGVFREVPPAQVEEMLRESFFAPHHQGYDLGTAEQREVLDRRWFETEVPIDALVPRERWPEMVQWLEGEEEQWGAFFPGDDPIVIGPEWAMVGVVVGTPGYVILDGWHRVADAVRRGAPMVRAIVGEADAPGATTIGARVPRSTPWGPSQDVTTIAPGITQHHTARHGGIHLSPERQRDLEQRFEFRTFAGGSWYEEDEDVAAVVVAFPEFFSPEAIAQAVRTVQRQAQTERWADVARYLESEGEPVVLAALGREAETAEAWRVSSIMTGGDGWEVTVRRGDQRRTFELADYPRSMIFTDDEVYQRVLGILPPEAPGPQTTVGCRKPVGGPGFYPDPSWRPDPADRIYLPGDPKEHFDAPELPLRRTRLGPAWLPFDSANTKFVYLVADENNFKEYHAVVFAGLPQAGDEELLRSRMEYGEFFDPADFGLPSLEGLLLQYTAVDALADAGLEVEEDSYEDDEEEEEFIHRFVDLQITRQLPDDRRSWTTFMQQTVRLLPVEGVAHEVEFSCRVCGEPVEVTISGVAHHLTPEGDIDYELDADHVALPDPEPGTTGARTFKVDGEELECDPDNRDEIPDLDFYCQQYEKFRRANADETWSAHMAGRWVQFYKDAARKAGKRAYKGQKDTDEGLARWYGAEEGWRDLTHYLKTGKWRTCGRATMPRSYAKFLEDFPKCRPDDEARELAKDKLKLQYAVYRKQVDLMKERFKPGDDATDSPTDPPEDWSRDKLRDEVAKLKRERSKLLKQIRQEEKAGKHKDWKTTGARLSGARRPDVSGPPSPVLDAHNQNRRFTSPGCPQVVWDAREGMGATGNNAEIRHFGFTALMRPADFLRVVLPLVGGPQERSIAGLEAGRLNPGWGPPMLYISTDSTPMQVIGHEGRHRATLFQQLCPDSLLPVAFMPQYMRARDIDEQWLQELRRGIISERHLQLGLEGRFVAGPLFDRVYLGDREIDLGAGSSIGRGTGTGDTTGSRETRGEDDWAYHATHRRWYEAIRESGLQPCPQPEEHSDEVRDFEGACIYFSHKPEGARTWNEILLRFPWPVDAVTGWYDDWRSERWVPPEQIQVYAGGTWHPLVDTPLRSLLRELGPERGAGGVTVGAPAAKWKWLPADVVYQLEPVAAEQDVSRVARHRPAQGGWHEVSKKAAEDGDVPSRSAIKKAIRKAEKQVGAPFYEWAYGSGPSDVDGVSYKRTRFTDDMGKSRKGDYGFMAFYDWVTAEGLDPNQYLTKTGDPDDDKIAKLSGRYANPERFAQWFSDWLRYRHNFLARHTAQMDKRFEDDGVPTDRHLGLIMWAGSPSPSRISDIAERL